MFEMLRISGKNVAASANVIYVKITEILFELLVIISKRKNRPPFLIYAI